MTALKMNIKVPGFKSETHAYPIDNGLLEGSPLSPLLYIIFINELLVLLESSGLGFTLGSIWLGVMLFADDLILIGRTPEELQQMLDLLHAHSRLARYKINADGKDTCVTVFQPSHYTVVSNKQLKPDLDTGHAVM